MNQNDIEKLMQDGAVAFEESLLRPQECLELEMELKTAMEAGDVAICREVLREKAQWLAKFKSHETVALLDVAIRAGSAAVELVDLLLKAGVPAHGVYDCIGAEYQHTPLVTAAECGRLDLIQKLVAAGADATWASPTGANALSEILPSRASQAPTHDTPELASVREWLTRQGLRIDPLCADSRRKLLWASSDPISWPDIPALLELGIPLASAGWTPFMLDVAMGRAEAGAVAKLGNSELSHRDAWKRTPFLLAVTAGDLELARALFERGGDLHAKGHCGITALHIAAKHNHCALIGWLLKNGFLLNAKDESGRSALRAAVDANSVVAAAFLLEKGSDARERDENDYALIHSVSFTADLAMLRLLLNAGADVNDISGGGSWPLRDACEAGNADAVKFLLQAGAKPNLTSTGETALFAAVSSDNFDCVRLLLEAGADVNAQDCDGWTCLFHLRSETMTRYLLENGASPKIADQCDGLPEDWERVPMPVRRLLKEWRKGRHKAKR